MPNKKGLIITLKRVEQRFGTVYHPVDQHSQLMVDHCTHGTRVTYEMLETFKIFCELHGCRLVISDGIDITWDEKDLSYVVKKDGIIVDRVGASYAQNNPEWETEVRSKYG